MDIMPRLARYARNGEFRLSTLKAATLCCIGVILNTFGSIYATERASNYVSDLILSNTRAYDLDGLFIYGAIFVIVFAVAVLLRDPKAIPFTLASIGLFYLVRSVFISLTHLGPFPTHASLELGTFLNLVFGGGDYFFSGHTGAPFLLALLFWRDIILRYLFLVASGVLGVVVLLTHLHYSIDVLSAFFITYGIYHMALWLFPKEARLFHEGIPGFSEPR
jgi:hypothetical protein